MRSCPRSPIAAANATPSQAICSQREAKARHGALPGRDRDPAAALQRAVQVVIERLGGRAPNLVCDHSGTDDRAGSIARLTSLKVGFPRIRHSQYAPRRRGPLAVADRRAVALWHEPRCAADVHHAVATALADRLTRTGQQALWALSQSPTSRDAGPERATTASALAAAPASLCLCHASSNGVRRLLRMDPVVEVSDDCFVREEQRDLTAAPVAKRKPASTVSGEQSDRRCRPVLAGRQARS